MLRRRARRRALLRRLGLPLKRSLLAVPAAYLAAAITFGFLAPAIDRGIGSTVDLDVGIGAARDILTATATGMIAFTGLVVAGILVVVQFSAGQYSPRLVLWFRRDLLVKHAIGSFPPFRSTRSSPCARSSLGGGASRPTSPWRSP